ncbi:uncharacterized protein LOC143548823 [Bidens hawaiensis]|uniref:uncharacterized protein LOC143548823 n=1 Tax=Bidens hawaiensis TaxID=980011 RepID=UPI00404A1E99
MNDKLVVSKKNIESQFQDALQIGLVQDLAFRDGDVLWLKYVSTSTVDLRVYDKNGIPLLFPHFPPIVFHQLSNLNTHGEHTVDSPYCESVVGYSHNPVIDHGDNNKAENSNCYLEFHKKIEYRMRLPAEVGRLANLKRRRLIKFRSLAGYVISSNIILNPTSNFSGSVSNINSGSTSSKRRVGRPRKTTNTTPIPMQQLNDFEFVVDVFKGISADYVDHGDQSFKCESCNACLWDVESRRGKKTADTTFSLCCRNGNVKLPDLKQPHETYFICLSYNESSSDADYYENYIINYLKEMLDSQNPLVQAYRMVRDTFKENPQIDFKLRIVGTRKYDARTYNLPTASEISALIIGDIGDAMDKRDIIVNSRSGGLRRISELHPSYTHLQFPLLYPFSEDGYKVDIPHRNVDPSFAAARKKCTMREFFAYRLQDRPNQFSLPLNRRRLLQQLLVDKYTMVESQKLHFIRGKQSELRSDTYESLRNLKTAGNSDVSTSGQRVILPSSFTGGSRYMTQNYLDAMCLCRCYHYPDFFLTITCNPGWPEVKRFLKDTNLNSEDRPDILCRIFKMKLDSMIKLLKDKTLFEKIKAAVYTIEFQKRCLPHAHICLFIAPENKIHNPSHIDNFISSEIPDKATEPDLYQLVSDHMLHGPCCKANPSFSMFTGWMEANRNYEHARRLSYAEFSTQFVWKKTSPPKWVERQSGFAIGRIYAVPASFDEAYYLRILLNKVKGPKCFEDIQTVDGFVCDSFRDACYRRGLLDDDKEYIEAIEEAAIPQTDII